MDRVDRITLAIIMLLAVFATVILIDTASKRFNEQDERISFNLETNIRLIETMNRLIDTFPECQWDEELWTPHSGCQHHDSVENQYTRELERIKGE